MQCGPRRDLLSCAWNTDDRRFISGAADDVVTSAAFPSTGEEYVAMADGMKKGAIFACGISG